MCENAVPILTFVVVAVSAVLAIVGTLTGTLWLFTVPVLHIPVTIAVFWAARTITLTAVTAVVPVPATIAVVVPLSTTLAIVIAATRRAARAAAWRALAAILATASLITATPFFAATTRATSVEAPASRWWSASPL